MHSSCLFVLKYKAQCILSKQKIKNNYRIEKNQTYTLRSKFPCKQKQIKCLPHIVKRWQDLGNLNKAYTCYKNKQMCNSCAVCVYFM